MIGLARKPQKLPDYFTAEEANALVVAVPSYPIRMAFRIMLRTGLRVSEALSLADTQRYVELPGAHHSWVAKL